MKDNKKMRIISCVLILCMLFSIMPTAAFATDGEVEDTVTPLTIDSEDETPTSSAIQWTKNMTVSELSEAIASATEDTVVVTVEEEVTMETGLTINKKVTINGNGSTIKRAAGNKGTLLYVGDGGNLVLNNVTLDGGAKWIEGKNPAERTNDSGVQADGSNYGGGQLLVVVTGGTATLQNGTILQNNERITDVEAVGDEGSAIYVFGGTLNMDKSTNILNNTVKSTETSLVGDGAAVSVESGAATISGKITGNHAERMSSAVRVFQGSQKDVIFEDVTITGNYCTSDQYGAVAIGVGASVSGKVVIKENFTMSGSEYVPANLSGNGGSLVDAELGNDSEIHVYKSREGFGGNVSIVMSNVTTNKANLFKADSNSMGIVYDADTKTVKVTNVVEVTTLEALNAALANGLSVKLGADIAGQVIVPGGKTVEIDLNGFDITNDGGIAVINNGALTINDSSEDQSGTIKSKTLEGISNTSTATALTINGGTVIGSGYAICDYATSSNNTVNSGILIVTARTDSSTGYVIGGHNSQGGTWSFGDGVIMKNEMAENQFKNWVKTNEDGTKATNGVAVTNYSDLTFGNDGKNTVVVTSKPVKLVLNGETTYCATLSEAVVKIQAGDEATIKLYANQNSGATIPADTKVTLDLNGCTIGQVTNNGDLTIDDSSESKEGTITGGHGVYNNNVLTVNGGHLIGTSNDGIQNTSNAKKLTINGGIIKGKNIAICDLAPNSINTVNAGTLKYTGSNLDNYAVASYGTKGGTWIFADGVIMSSQNFDNHWVNFNEADSTARNNGQILLVNAHKTSFVIISADGAQPVTAKVTVTQYASLNDELEAIAASGKPAYIMLDKDVTGPINVPADAKVVLDLNGYEITGGINNYGDLTIEDSKGDGKIISANPGIGVCNFNKLTVNAGTIEGMDYEGICNMNTAVSLDINGGTVSGGGYAVCDYGVNSINTVTGGTLISKARGVGSGIGYVIGSYGSSKGGTWVSTSGVTMKKEKADDKWVNTDENGQASGAAQVALANAGAVAFAKNENGTVTTTEKGSLKETVLANVKAQAEALKAAIDAAEGLTDAEKTAMKANVNAMVSNVETEIASGNVADIALAASKAAAVSEVLEKALEAYEAIAEMTDDTRKAELKAEVKTAVDTATGASGTILTATTTDGVAKAKTDAITAIELALVEAKADAAQNLTSGDKAEIDAALDAVEAGTDSADKGVAKVENILNKADMVSEINAMDGLTADDKTKLVDVAETAKETAATNIGTAADANAVALAAAKAEANYEAIAAVADAYAYINSQNLSTATKDAAKAALYTSLATAQSDINGAGNVAEIGHALQTLLDKIDGIKADNTRGWSSSGGGFSGVYNYQVTAPQVDNCVVTVSDSSAVAGEIVTITTKPDGGYGVSEVIVTDKNGNEIEVTALGNGQFTFVMPAGGVDVSVVCKPAITMVIDSLYINIFGKIVKNDVAPKIVDGRTVLPIRVVAEALGADVDWDPDTQKVTITKGDTVIELFIGKTIAYVNGEPVQLDVAPFIENDRTYLPVRFVSEYLGAIVNWDAETRTVIIVPGE